MFPLSRPNEGHHDAEHNAINRFNPNTGMIEPFVRSPFIQVGAPTRPLLGCALNGVPATVARHSRGRVSEAGREFPVFHMQSVGVTRPSAALRH